MPVLTSPKEDFYENMTYIMARNYAFHLTSKVHCNAPLCAADISTLMTASDKKAVAE